MKKYCGFSFESIFQYSLHHIFSTLFTHGTSDCKESACNARDPGSILESGRCHGEGNQYSCLENPMDRRACRLQSMGLQKVGHDWLTNILFIKFQIMLSNIYVKFCRCFSGKNQQFTNIGGGGGLIAKLCPTLATPWTVNCQAPLSMGFSRQKYWGRLPFPSPGHLSSPGIKLGLLHCRQIFYWLSYKRSPISLRNSGNCLKLNKKNTKKLLL